MTENNAGLFEFEDAVYTLKMNMNKVETIEAMLDISFIADLQKNGGILSFRMLKTIFSVALYDVTNEVSVKGAKAVGIYERLLHDVGLSTVMTVTLAKVEEDLGFLFQGN